MVWQVVFVNVTGTTTTFVGVVELIILHQKNSDHFISHFL